MAETTPTDPNNSGTSPERKPVSSNPKPPSSLFGEIFDTLKWIWEIVHDLLVDLAAFAKWCRINPLAGIVLAILSVCFFYFIGIFHPFKYGEQSLATWSWTAWNVNGQDTHGTSQSHGALAPLVTIVLLLYHRKELAKLSPKGSSLGLVPLLFGILVFVLGVRSLNPRMALVSIPFMLFGATLFVWGRAAARMIFFPCVFLFFMIPLGALEQATNHLQFVITGAIGKLSHLFGIAIAAVGTTLRATDGTFNFQIAEGCSGIHSLVAMTMLTAVFVHLTQDRLWKKVVIFSFSLVFAIIGNIGRIFTVVLVAKFYDPVKASTTYHDYSGFVFFPFAILAMLLVTKIVNLDFKALAQKAEAKAKSLDKEPAKHEY